MKNKNIKLTIKEDAKCTEKINNTTENNITNITTIKAIEEGLELLKHPEDGAKSLEEFWSDLL
jgi:hypothetical protein